MTRSSDIADLGEDGFADSSGVKIHYVSKGAGVLAVLIHGFPGFWYDWRQQIPALAQHFQVVAIDQRGFNLSDQPDGVEHYKLDKLVSDVDAVVRHFGQQKAIIVGHDAGAWISWHYAMTHPDKTERLVIVNLPHPGCLEREWRKANSGPRSPYPPSLSWQGWFRATASTTARGPLPCRPCWTTMRPRP